MAICSLFLEYSFDESLSADGAAAVRLVRYELCDTGGGILTAGTYWSLICVAVASIPGIGSAMRVLGWPSLRSVSLALDCTNALPTPFGAAFIVEGLAALETSSPSEIDIDSCVFGDSSLAVIGDTAEIFDVDGTEGGIEGIVGADLMGAVMILSWSGSLAAGTIERGTEAEVETAAWTESDEEEGSCCTAGTLGGAAAATRVS